MNKNLLISKEFVKKKLLEFLAEPPNTQLAKRLAVEVILVLERHFGKRSEISAIAIRRGKRLEQSLMSRFVRWAKDGYPLNSRPGEADTPGRVSIEAIREVADYVLKSFKPGYIDLAGFADKESQQAHRWLDMILRSGDARQIHLVVETLRVYAHGLPERSSGEAGEADYLSGEGGND